MKRICYFALALALSGTQLTACKNKKAETPVTTADSLNPAPKPAPVEISADTTLTNGLKDATKDFPGVTAEVNNGEVTLTGRIKRDRLAVLMQSVNALHPKKVNNKLTIE